MKNENVNKMTQPQPIIYYNSVLCANAVENPYGPPPIPEKPSNIKKTILKE